jgi:hypothetical protein
MDTPRNDQEAATPREREVIAPDADRIGSESGFEHSERQGLGGRTYVSPGQVRRNKGCIGCGGAGASALLIALAALLLSLF